MTRKKWMAFKKALPKNWAQIVSETLTNKGVQLSAQQVSMIRSGQIKNYVWQEHVWREIKELHTISNLRERELDALKAA